MYRGSKCGPLIPISIANARYSCTWADRRDESRGGGNIRGSGAAGSESAESGSAGDAEGEVGGEGEGEGVGVEEWRRREKRQSEWVAKVTIGVVRRLVASGFPSRTIAPAAYG